MKNNKQRELQEGECPRCHGFETFIRHSIKFGDVDYVAFMTKGFDQPIQMVAMEFHCRECSFKDTIYGRDDLKAAIRELYRDFKQAKSKEGKAMVKKEINHWQDILNQSTRIPRDARMGLTHKKKSRKV